MTTYRIHYLDDRRVEHEVGFYIADRQLDPHREEDRDEIVWFIRRNCSDHDAEAWLHYAPHMPDNGLEPRG